MLKGETRQTRVELIKAASALAMAAYLAGCGGGGAASSGTNAPPTSAPSPSPVPTPTPAPTPSAADSAEYKASGAVVSAKSAYAFDRNITGKGVTIAVIDSGINRTTPEFAGRISADSTGFEQRIARCATCAAETLPPYPIDDKDGHGTTVASIAAAARNGTGVQGVAPDATVLVLKIVAPDLSGQTAGSTGPIPESTQPNAMLIAPAIRYAVDKGAFVSVLAVNGAIPGPGAAEQRSAMDAVRTADRLLVQSVSNVTGEDSFTGQFAENLVGGDRANKDWFLFAVGLDQNGNARSANGNAGPLSDRMIAAAGNGVQAVDKDGNYVTVTGNSFAAPAVAGAAALLKQYWPNLGGKAIARILLDTATDAGVPGVDQVFGVGILNVEKAMQAQAPASAFVEAEKRITRFSSLTTSSAFGGASAAAKLNAELGRMTVLDTYGRDFAMVGRAGVRASRDGLRTSGMLSFDEGAPIAQYDDDRRFGIMSITRGTTGRRNAAPALLSFSPAVGQTVTMTANMPISGSATLSGSALRGIGSMPVGATVQWSGDAWSARALSGNSRDHRSHMQSLAVNSPLGVGFELATLSEDRQALGLRGDATLGIRGAGTHLATFVIDRKIGDVSLTGRATRSVTRVRGGSGPIQFNSRLIGTAFSLQAERSWFGGQASVGISSPLRLEKARAAITAPVLFDLITGSTIDRVIDIDLAPDAREVDLEFGWSVVLSRNSSFRIGAARAFNAGNVSGMSDYAGFMTLVLR